MAAQTICKNCMNTNTSEETMSILICGGAGYIGAHCAHELKKAGYDCIVYDNLSEGHASAVSDFKFIKGDLRDSVKLDAVFEEHPIAGVIHFAARSLVGESMKSPIDYYENNVTGTISLLKSMQKANVKNIVFSSTCAVYGLTKQIPITEEVPVNPINPYGETKLAAEQFLKWCDVAYGIKSVCLRYFNAAGAMPDGSLGEAHSLETHLIPLVFMAALDPNRTLQVYGSDYPTKDGSCVRDYIHVLDLADAHIKALQYLLAGGESQTFNLGSETGVSVLEIIEKAQEISQKKITYKITGRRPGDPATLIASSEKARRVLGWRPVRSDIETILQDAWKWHNRQ